MNAQRSSCRAIKRVRPPALRRSWLFVGGADDAELSKASGSGADVVILELEDFTAPGMRPVAREKAAELFDAWRAVGLIAAVRINPLETEDGLVDLEAVMRGRPDAVLHPKVAEPHQVECLDARVSCLERDLGIPNGSTELVPNIELARGLMQTYKICRASERVSACLVASEDMAADLGAERGPDGLELNYVCERFLLECVASDVVAVDCPYTWVNLEGVERETLHARRLGYKAKSVVNADHVATINTVLTPSADEVGRAREVVTKFETAQGAGAGRMELNGTLVELPIYLNAKRVTERAEALAEYDQG